MLASLESGNAWLFASQRSTHHTACGNLVWRTWTNCVKISDCYCREFQREQLAVYATKGPPTGTASLRRHFLRSSERTSQKMWVFHVLCWVAGSVTERVQCHWIVSVISFRSLMHSGCVPQSCVCAQFWIGAREKGFLITRPVLSICN